MEPSWKTELKNRNVEARWRIGLVDRVGEDMDRERDGRWNRTAKKLGAKGGTEIESRREFMSASRTSPLH